MRRFGVPRSGQNCLEIAQTALAPGGLMTNDGITDRPSPKLDSAITSSPESEAPAARQFSFRRGSRLGKRTVQLDMLAFVWLLVALVLIAYCAGFAPSFPTPAKDPVAAARRGRLLLPQDAIGPPLYERVERGMTRAEACALVGMLPGDHYTGPRQPNVRGTATIPFDGMVLQRRWGVDTNRDSGDRPPGNPRELAPSPHIDEWRGNRYLLRIASDDRDRVVGYSLAEMHIPDSFFEGWTGPPVPRSVGK